MSRFVFCGICDTNLGVLFERDVEDDSPGLDFLPHDDCWHVSRQQLVEDLEALHSEESSLPVSLKADCGRSQNSCRVASGRPPAKDQALVARLLGREALRDGRRLVTPAVNTIDRRSGVPIVARKGGAAEFLRLQAYAHGF
jgi:hypothetical protein